jgi:hypothetical protein
MLSSADTLKDPAMMLATIGFWAYIKSIGGNDFDDGVMRLVCRPNDNASTLLAQQAEAAEAAAAVHLVERHGLPPSQAGGVMRSIRHAVAMDPVMSGTNFVLRAAWYHYGMPVITMGHKLAASYMCTKMPPEVVNEIKAPFPTFMLEIPDGLLTFEDEGKVVTARAALVGHLPDAVFGRAWSCCVYTDGIATLWRKHWKLSEFTKQSIETDPRLLSAFGIEMTSMDARSMELLGRLIASAMLHMTENDHVAKVGKGHATYKGPGRSGAEPTRRIYQLRHNVKHDMRESVQAYVAGKAGSSLAIQLVVSGHWKQVVHGTGGTLRRRQFIEPYWKGPEDAPIAFRKHDLQDKSQDPAKIGDKEGREPT